MFGYTVNATKQLWKERPFFDDDAWEIVYFDSRSIARMIKTREYFICKLSDEIRILFVTAVFLSTKQREARIYLGEYLFDVLTYFIIKMIMPPSYRCRA